MKAKNIKQEWAARILTLLLLSLGIHFFLMENRGEDFTNLIEIKVTGDEKEIVHEIKKLDRNDIVLETEKLYPTGKKQDFLSDIVIFALIFSLGLGIFHLVYTAVLRLLNWNFRNEDSPSSVSEDKKIWAARILAVLVMAIGLHFLPGEDPPHSNEPYTKKIEVKVKGNEEEVISAVNGLNRLDIVISSRKLRTSRNYSESLNIILRIFLSLAVTFGIYYALYTAILRFLRTPKDGEPPVPGLAEDKKLKGARIKNIPQGIEITIPSREGLPSRGGGFFSRAGSFFWLIFWTFGGIFAFIALFKAIIAKITGQPDENPILFLAIWLVGWGFGEGMALYTLFKKEKIAVSKAAGEMTIGTELFGFDIKKTTYEIFKIKNLRLASPLDKKDENLLFDYESRLVKCCKGIDAEDANTLFQELSGILVTVMK